MIILKSSIKKLLQEAEQKGYERGCIDGYKNCESQQRELLRKVRELAFNEGLTKSPFYFEKDSNLK